jgi:hypothetical protein
MYSKLQFLPYGIKIGDAVKVTKAMEAVEEGFLAGLKL